MFFFLFILQLHNLKHCPSTYNFKYDHDSWIRKMKQNKKQFKTKIHLFNNINFIIFLFKQKKKQHQQPQQKAINF